MNLQTAVFFVLGLGMLIAGAELLVRGASRLAAAMHISPLVIGLTVVAYGTSAPELAVSTASAFRGQADIALGNVVGSNICNVLLILGVSALVTALAVKAQLVKFDVPLMIVLSVLVMVLGWDGLIGRWDGLLLAAGAIVYTVVLIKKGRADGKAAEGGAPAEAKPRWLVNIVLVVAGVGTLVLGSQWLVDGAVAMARALGVSELMIGLTIIAVGTSLPEVATSLVAAFRGERDIAVGNVVGSNIFNILMVLGFSAAVSPSGVRVAPEALHLDIPVMIAVALACLPIFFTGFQVSRGEGALLLGYYVVYMGYLVLTATSSSALPLLQRSMGIALPVTFLALFVLALRAARRQKVPEPQPAVKGEG